MDIKNQGSEKREQIFKRFYAALDRIRSFSLLLKDFCRFSFILASLAFFIVFIYYIGFPSTEFSEESVRHAFRLILIVLCISKYLPDILLPAKHELFALVSRIVLLIFCLLVIFVNHSLIDAVDPFWKMFSGNIPVITANALLIISEISVIFDLISRIDIHPSLIFSGSFFCIILIGAGLLLLPNSSRTGLSVTDSLFTSVSAVCVTGLVVTDTASSFTELGKLVIMLLIQIGGLGIMTFTGFFSYIFTTRSTFLQRLLLKDIFSAESMGNLFKILIKIVLFTFLVEGAGALIIFWALDDKIPDRLFLAVFHAISAFCNAGFSTIPGGLAATPAAENLPMQGTVALLVILGGIGFPVLIKLYAYVKYKTVFIFKKLSSRRLPVYKDSFGIDSMIALRTTVLLLIAGTIIFYLFERRSSLEGISRMRQIFISFFNSVTARTAGFNVDNLSAWSYPAVFLIIILMWIGASPGSTGGGIKTTAFSIAVRNAWNNIRGRQVLEIFNREISSGTISRILAIITLSVVTIITGFFCLLLSETGRNPVHLLFECVSAFGTVGLSIADTATFSQAGKIILMILMFVGRIGPLTLLTGFIVSRKRHHYRYPVTDIMIN